MPNFSMKESANGSIILYFSDYSIMINKYATHAPNAQSPSVCTIAISHRTGDTSGDKSKAFEKLASLLMNVEDYNAWVAKLVEVSDKKV